MAKSRIEWTDCTWNPTVGCSIKSAGCKNCYAMTMAYRLERMAQRGTRAGAGKYIGLTDRVLKETRGENGQMTLTPKNVWNGVVRLDRDSLDFPSTLKKPRKIFVNSMSDLFHEDLEFDAIHEVFRAMIDNPQHIYQILTKRPLKMVEYVKNFFAPENYFTNEVQEKYRKIFNENFWFGVSVEDGKQKARIDILRRVPIGIKFLSVEPLIDDVGELDLRGIDWVIVGGETGAAFRPVKIDWVRSIRDQCLAQNVPFFFKQWGGNSRTRFHLGVFGRELDGREWNEFPRIGSANE